MSKTQTELVAEAEGHLAERRFGEAAKCFEEAAALARYKAGIAQLLTRAAGAHAEYGAIRDAGRCYLHASRLLEAKEKAECLMAYWRALILAIAGTRYDCGFEWKGEPGHHEDHVAYEQEVREDAEEAERVLAEAVRIEGVDRDAVIEQARAVCRERQKDGWGAAECQAIVENATRIAT
jgi:hypothetical protein